MATITSYSWITSSLFPMLPLLLAKLETIENLTWKSQKFRFQRAQSNLPGANAGNQNVKTSWKKDHD